MLPRKLRKYENPYHSLSLLQQTMMVSSDDDQQCLQVFRDRFKRNHLAGQYLSLADLPKVTSCEETWEIQIALLFIKPTKSKWFSKEITAYLIEKKKDDKTETETWTNYLKFIKICELCIL